MDIKPTIETILERVNLLGEQMKTQVDALSQQAAEGVGLMMDSFAIVNTRLNGIEESMQRLNTKVDILNESMLELKTDHRLLSRRVSDLERKAS